MEVHLGRLVAFLSVCSCTGGQEPVGPASVSAILGRSGPKRRASRVRVWELVPGEAAVLATQSAVSLWNSKLPLLH